MNLNKIILEIGSVNMSLLIGAILFFVFLLDYVFRKIGIRISIRFIIQFLFMCFLIYIGILILIYSDEISYIYSIIMILSMLLDRTRLFIREFKLRKKYLVYAPIIYLLAAISIMLLFELKDM